MRIMELLEENRDLKMEEEKQEDEEKNRTALFKVFPEPSKLIVGYALTSKKTKSFLQPKLQGLARYL